AHPENGNGCITSIQLSYLPNLSMNKSTKFVLMSATLVVCAYLSAGFALAEPKSVDRIPRNIGTLSNVPLRGNVHPLASSLNDRGPVSASFSVPHVTMMFKTSDAQQAQLDTLLQQQQDPASPNYHRWLSPDEFGDQFGLSANDLTKVI